MQHNSRPALPLISPGLLVSYEGKRFCTGSRVVDGTYLVKKELIESAASNSDLVLNEERAEQHSSIPDPPQQPPLRGLKLVRVYSSINLNEELRTVVTQSLPPRLVKKRSLGRLPSLYSVRKFEQASRVEDLRSKAIERPQKRVMETHEEFMAQYLHESRMLKIEHSRYTTKESEINAILSANHGAI